MKCWNLIGSASRLLDVRTRLKPQIRRQNEIIKKNILRWLPTRRFLAKTLRANKFDMKDICRSESTLNCRSRHSRIKLTHLICLCEKLGRNPNKSVINLPWKSFFKISCSESTLSCRLTYKINSHNISGVRT